MHYVPFHLPAPVAAPRIAPVAAWMAAQIVFALRHAMRYTHACMAGLWRRPVSPRDTPSRRLSETAAVRRYAQEMLSHDPRFAADLFAAADRHERGE